MIFEQFVAIPRPWGGVVYYHTVRDCKTCQRPALKFRSALIALHEPVASSDTSAGRAKNRRVEIDVAEPKH